MCNVNKLLGIIKENGFTLDMLASMTNMSRATLARRLKNSDDFTIKEIRAIKAALHLSNEEAVQIFLYPNSLKNETNDIEMGM